MVKLKSLLSNSKNFLKKSKLVKINKKNIPILAAKLLNLKLVFKEAVNFSYLPPIFYLLIDSLNFCFWNLNGSQKFSYKNKNGSVAFALALKDNFKKAEKYLYSNSTKFYKVILENTSGQLLLKEERIKIIKEISEFLKKNNLVSILNYFQNKDVDLAANFFVHKLPYAFGDRVKKLGIELPFYKKLRLFISDLIDLAGFKFKNKEKLLIFADASLPKVFIAEKVLVLKPKIENQILKGKIFKPNSLMEISWRAATVVCASELKKIMPHFSYQKIDRLLWLYSKKINYPMPKVLSRFY